MPPGPLDRFFEPPRPQPAAEFATLQQLNSNPNSTFSNYCDFLEHLIKQARSMDAEKKALESEYKFVDAITKKQQLLDYLDFIYNDVIVNSIFANFEGIGPDCFIIAGLALDKSARILISQQQPEKYATKAYDFLEQAEDYFNFVAENSADSLTENLKSKHQKITTRKQEQKDWINQQTAKKRQARQQSRLNSPTTLYRAPKAKSKNNAGKTKAPKPRYYSLQMTAM